MQIDIECLLYCITMLAKTLESTEIESIKDVIILVTQLGDEYVAIRLQVTKFIVAISPRLGKRGTEAANLVNQYMEYILAGFQNAELTLRDSAFAFGALCQDCAVVLAPYT